MSEFFYFVEDVIASNPLWSIPLVFFSGVLVSLTPCFYPLIPVILGIVGIDKDTSKKESLLLGLVYILGLSLIYTILGIISSLTGSIFGLVSKHPAVQFLGAAVFLFLGLALLDIVHLPSLLKFNITSRRFSILEVFGIGILSGLVVGGCTFPVLGAILVLIAFGQDVFIGGLLLFVFSLGIGTVFLVVVLFGASIMERLKKNRLWFAVAKRFMGVCILGVCVYFLVRGFYLLG